MYLKNNSKHPISIDGCIIGASSTVQIDPAENTSSANIFIESRMMKSGNRIHTLIEDNCLEDVEKMGDFRLGYEILGEPQVIRVQDYLREKEDIGILERSTTRLDPDSEYIMMTIYGIRLKMWYEVVLPELKRLANIVTSAVYWGDTEKDPHVVCKGYIWIGEPK